MFFLMLRKRSLEDNLKVKLVLLDTVSSLSSTFHVLFLAMFSLYWWSNNISDIPYFLYRFMHFFFQSVGNTEGDRSVC